MKGKKCVGTGVGSKSIKCIKCCVLSYKIKCIEVKKKLKEKLKSKTLTGLFRDGILML